MIGILAQKGLSLFGRVPAKPSPEREKLIGLLDMLVDECNREAELVQDFAHVPTAMALSPAKQRVASTASSPTASPNGCCAIDGWPRVGSLHPSFFALGRLHGIGNDRGHGDQRNAARRSAYPDA